MAMKSSWMLAAIAALAAGIASHQALGFAAPSASAALPPVASEAGPINVERLATLNRPWGMDWLPDGGLIITEMPGQLRIFADGELSEPITGVPAVAFTGQGGLLDVAVDPDFERNRMIYISYAEAASQQPPDAKETAEPRFLNFIDLKDNVLKGTAVARGRLESGALHDVTVIWRQVPNLIGRGHYSGRLLFGRDGTLFITSGDRMRFDPAQDPTASVGKVVRINRDGTIPSDNPFAKGSEARADIWTIGHRNVLGIAFEPDSGNLWAHEMGPKGGDELNLLKPSANYGWPTVSEGVNYNDAAISKHSTRPEFRPPVRSWTPVISPSGLIFYTGDRFPGWRGSALMGGLSSQALIRLTLDGDKVTGEERIAMGRRIRDVIQAPDGSILLLADGENADLLRLTPGAR
jgi:glucose/arabinose dehydrogenase